MKARLEKIAEILDAFRQRTEMYIDPVSPEEAEKFLYGFDVGCFACGVQFRWQDIAEQRGWILGTTSPIVAEMRAKGLSDDRIINELISIREEAAKRCPIYLEVHLPAQVPA
ncbi:MAG TPA: hypothetical protein VGI40_13475 [Pirellulaceae bacterium]|jgi:hypothetical protein